MAQNDMEVIMYKILSYLYECMKAGKRPRPEDFCYDCGMFRISEMYWNQIMAELIEQGFIRGFVQFTSKDGITVQTTAEAGITYKGREFLRDNSTMQKVRQLLGNAFSITLNGIISAMV